LPTGAWSSSLSTSASGKAAATRCARSSPTGVVELDRPGHTLGDFFAVWRMPLSQRSLLTFRGAVTAYVAGRRWKGDVTSIPLSDHAQIVVEIGGYIPPHRAYLFPPQ
jgi:hypothetical protein